MPDEKINVPTNTFTDQSFWDKLKGGAKKAGREVVTQALILYYVFRDDDTPAKPKLVIGAALAYFIFPVDVIPDFIPAMGLTDDLSVLLFAIKQVRDHIKPEHREMAEAKLGDWFDPEDEDGESV